MMNYRKRFEECLNHRETDRPPIDFCGTTLTACHSEIIKKLADHYLISADNEEIAQNKIQEIFDIDFRRIGELFDPESAYLDYSQMSKGVFVDSWGIKRRYQGIYWDIVNSPLKDLDMRELKSFKWPDASGISKDKIFAIKEKAQRLYNDTDYVIVGEHPVYGYLEIGCWMFGFDDFLYRLAAEPETTEWFFENYNKYVNDVIDLYYGAIGDYIHVTTSGDDFGTQTGLFISPEMFAERIKPWYKERITHTKQLTKAGYFHHSCGSVYRLLDELIDMGVDFLNPIQPGAFEMEPERLKDNYGDKIVFWGGIDEQGLLTNGTPQEVAAEVRRIRGIMGKNGGWVMAASHNIQPDVPVENIIAMMTLE
ncbi:MAG: uroporphyrinogen decarboxylase family protein [Saccharofermentanales bacterium]